MALVGHLLHDLKVVLALGVLELDLPILLDRLERCLNDKKFELRQKRLRSSIVPDFKLSSATSGCYSLRKSTGRGSYVSNTKH